MQTNLFRKNSGETDQENLLDIQCYEWICSKIGQINWKWQFVFSAKLVYFSNGRIIRHIKNTIIGNYVTSI